MTLSKKAMELNATERLEVMAAFYASNIPKQKVDEEIKVFMERYVLWYHSVNQFEGMKDAVWKVLNESK